jgi:hypothetical protein
MSIRRFITITAGGLLAAALFVPVAHAGVGDQAIFVTFQQPVRIPGHTLAPGTYYFARIDGGSSADASTFVVYKGDRSHPVAVIETQPVDRQDVTNRIILTFSEGAKGRPPALVEWFYPGELEGHQFAYSAKRERRIENSPELILAANSKGATVVPGVNGSAS